MIQRTLDSHGSSLPLLAACGAIACAALACNDERLRELGYTSGSVTVADPGMAPTPPEDCEAILIDADSLVDAVAADLAAAPAESRPFLRYLSLANRFAEAACPADVARDRLGVTRLLNSVSRTPVAAAPRAGGPLDSVIVVDLRDYGFDRPIEVEGRSYSDGWEAVLGESTYDVELSGETAAAIAEAARTRVPLLSADAFLFAASEGPLYYALLGVPATLGELRASVGLPSELDPVASGGQRTAIALSRILRARGNFRVLDRYEIDAGSAGTYWEATAIPNGDFLDDPLHIQPNLQRLITYTLPNDFFAFAAYDADGQRRVAPELVLDTNRDDFQATVFASCANCHWQGLIPGSDDAGEAILSHADQFDPEIVAAYQAGPSRAERQAQFLADSEPYQRALLSLGITTESSVDPFIVRYFSATEDVSLEIVAADLLVTPEVLLARLGELSPALRPLGLGLDISRQRFGEVYSGTYCVLHAEDANPPAGPCAP